VELSRADIETKIGQLRASLNIDQVRFWGAKPFDVEAAHSLYLALLGPAANAISQKRHLIVITPGALASFPFHVLVTERPSTKTKSFADYRGVAWLTLKYAVTALPSVVSLQSLRETSVRNAAPKAYLGFGDPVFDKLPRLPGSANEVRETARTLAASQNVRLQRDATERDVKTIPLAEYRVLHFATHGLDARGTSMNGGKLEPSLALTYPQSASDLDDGFLTASEVATLQLNSDLVLLSACETAAADTSGEALSGLVRAFFYAGSRSVLVSYSSVETAAAVRLITRTIASLEGKRTLSPAFALRQSMNEMINDKTGELNAYPGM
jgi:CHAT domain-containing protein